MVPDRAGPYIRPGRCGRGPLILLPIGHDSQTTRRLPWITFGLMAACAITWLALLPLVATSQFRIATEFARTMEWWQRHPGLAPDPWLVEFLEGTVGTADPRRLFPGSETAAGRNREPRTDVDPREEFARRTGALREAVEGHPFRRFGLVPARPRAPAFLTHMFLHGGLGHLLGNLLILFLVGPFVEDAWGRPLYAGFYLFSGLAAAVVHLAFHAGSMVPVIGASGAIAGVMGAFLVRYWNTRMRFFYMIGFIVRGTFTAPSWLMLSLWAALEIVSGVASSTAGIVAGTAHWAHVGGFATGVGVALAMRHWRIEERFVHPAIESRITTRAASAGIVERGDRQGAAAAWRGESSRVTGSARYCRGLDRSASLSKITRSAALCWSMSKSRSPWMAAMYLSPIWATATGTSLFSMAASVFSAAPGRPPALRGLSGICSSGGPAPSRRALRPMESGR